MKYLIAAVILLVFAFIIFAVGILTGIALIKVKEEMDYERH